MAHTGVVKKYNSDKGFGFIVPQGTNQDLFVLRTDVIGGSLQAGDKVTFDEGFNERTGKPKAVNVTGGSGPQGLPGKGDGEGGKGKGKRGDKGKGGPKQQMPGLAGLNGGLAVGPLPGSPCPCGPCGPCAGGGCGLPMAGKPMGMPGVPSSGKTGLVKFFNDEKGFGFIKQDDGGTDLFVHRNDIIDQLLKEGDRVTYSEAVDSRTGRMKAHQVAGGTGGAKPPEKGKGKGKKGKGGKSQQPSLEAPPMPSLDAGSGAKMSTLAAQFGCGGAGGAGAGALLMGKPGGGLEAMPGDGAMTGGMAGGACGLYGCGGCGLQPCGGCNLNVGCGGNCGGCAGGNCGCSGTNLTMPQNLNTGGNCGGGCVGCCGGCGCNPCGACGGCGTYTGCTGCGGCPACGGPGSCFGNAQVGGTGAADVSQLGAMCQRLANAGVNPGASGGFDHDFADYGGQGGAQTLAARQSANACFANLAGGAAALGGGNQGIAGMTAMPGGDNPNVPGGCFGQSGDTAPGATPQINAAMFERLASATSGGNFEDQYPEYGAQGGAARGNMAATGAGNMAFANLAAGQQLPSMTGAGGNLLGAGGNQGGMPAMTLANMQAMAASMGQQGMYQMGNPTLPTGNVSHGNL